MKMLYSFFHLLWIRKPWFIYLKGFCKNYHHIYIPYKVKWKWSCSVVSNSLRPVDCSPPSSSVHGILQARILEWVAISFSRGSSQPRDQTQVSCIAGRHFNLWATREAHIPYKFTSIIKLQRSSESENISHSVMSNSLRCHGL